MINDIKMSFKILKYGINYKTSIAFAIIFFVLGFALEMLGSSLITALYIPIVGIYFGQLIHSVVQSTMVQTSPYKKAMETKLPAIAMTVILLAYNTFGILWKLLLMNINPERKEELSMALLGVGVMTIMVMVYFAFSMKFFYPATIIFFIVFYSFCFTNGYNMGAHIAGSEMFSVNISMPVAIIFSYICMILGCVIVYGVSVLLYKKDYSQQNFKKVLDRAK